MKAQDFNFKNLVDKIHKQIVKELKLNINYHLKIGKKIITFFNFNNAW
jgi:hypothetical protein